ncbi:MAG: hypothetical protein WC627_02605 [Legionella sp.]|jgi:hypothetical protein
MSNKKKNRTTVVNPCSGAATISLAGALAVAIGASIRNNNVHDEAVINLN